MNLRLLIVGVLTGVEFAFIISCVRICYQLRNELRAYKRYSNPLAAARQKEYDELKQAHNALAARHFNLERVLRFYLPMLESDFEVPDSVESVTLGSPKIEKVKATPTGEVYEHCGIINGDPPNAVVPDEKTAGEQPKPPPGWRRDPSTPNAIVPESALKPLPAPGQHWMLGNEELVIASVSSIDDLVTFTNGKMSYVSTLMHPRNHYSCVKLPAGT